MPHFPEPYTRKVYANIGKIWIIYVNVWEHLYNDDADILDHLLEIGTVHNTQSMFGVALAREYEYIMCDIPYMLHVSNIL